MSNIGEHVQVSVFGESHGEAVGMVLTGIPAGETVNIPMLEAFMKRRAPGQFPWSTPRKEEDIPIFLSGMTDGKTNGFPICAIIQNTGAHPQDYDTLQYTPRPGHADYTAALRYAGKADMRGGGHFSGRLTASLCIAGGICLQILQRKGVAIGAHAMQIGTVQDVPYTPTNLQTEELYKAAEKNFPTNSEEVAKNMIAEIEAVQKNENSIGGIVECGVIGMPAGIGGPLFEGLEGKLAKALFGIPAVKGVSFGAGFQVANMLGSENNDAYHMQNGKIQPATNHSGGMLGGITTGMPLLINIAVKPTPSIKKPQKTVHTATLHETEILIEGRHDPCIVPRAVPVVEAVTALVLLDCLYQQKGEAAL